jgi:precorrin-6A/cobalt-precorrin-6A reductase
VKLLILGGTSAAKTLARELHDKGIEVVYSIAGLVRQPDLPCEVISGGFSIRGGLSRYVQDNSITALLDATHPFASKISQTAIDISEQHNIKLWRYKRPEWVATPEDNWTFFYDWSDLLRALAPYQSIFLTQGQLTESMLATLHQHRKSGQLFIHRTAVEPKHRIPEWMKWVQGIGPFTLEDELALIQKFRVKVLVSKHSGGDIPNKLIAARSLNLPMLLLGQREGDDLNESGSVFTDLSALVDVIS